MEFKLGQVLKDVLGEGLIRISVHGSNKSVPLTHSSSITNALLLIRMNSMITTYAKNGQLEEARGVFDTMPQRDVVSWNAIIATYVRARQGEEALILFWKMGVEGVKPNRVTYVSILDACANMANLGMGKAIHASVANCILDLDVVVGTAVINLYGRCGCIESAKHAFNKLSRPNVVSWNALIAAHASNNEAIVAFELMWEMESKGVKANKITFVSILNVCAILADLKQGKLIHARISPNDFESDCILGTALVNMYGKCGSLGNAKRVFDKVLHRDVVLWTAMIAVCCHNGDKREALNLLEKMELEGMKPNDVTFITLLDACVNESCLRRGKVIHANLVYLGCDRELVASNALVSMYGKCRSLEEAKNVFDKMPWQDTISWNVMMLAYAMNGHLEGAISVFNNMLERNAVSRNALIEAYVKNGHSDDLRITLNRMAQQDVTSWNPHMTSCFRNGQEHAALELFQHMDVEDSALFFNPPSEKVMATVGNSLSENK